VFATLAPGSAGQGGCEPGECPNLTIRSAGGNIVSDVVVVEATVANTGENASSPSIVQASAPGWSPAETEVGALKLTETRTVTIRLPIPEDAGGTTHTITVTVDPSGSVSETQEDDNTDTFRISVPSEPRPDLLVRSTGAPRIENETLVLGVEVRNGGDADSPETTVAAGAPGWTLLSEPVSALHAAGSERLELRLAIPPEAAGAQVLTVTVDPNDSIAEGSEDNNTEQIKVSLPGAPQTPRPDLAPSGLRATVEPDAVVLMAAVRNLGDAQAGATSVEATAPGWSPARSAVSALTAGQARDVSLRVPIADEQREASHAFTLTVDPEDVVRESSNENNAASITVLVPPAGRPDLTVAPQGEPVVADGDVTLTVMVRNVGDSPADETSVEATAPGWEPASADIDGLGPRGRDAAELTLSIPEDAPATDQEFVLTVDPDDELEEGSEANNRAVVVAAIPAGAAEDGGVPLWPFVVGGALLLLGAAFLAFRALTRPRFGAGALEPLAVPTVPARTVNIGFAPAGDSGNPLATNQTLECGQRYYFWLDVGEAVAESIELVPTALPEQLPDHTTLKVALFSLEGGLELDPDLQVSKLHLGPKGSDERLLFPLRAPDDPGTAQLRCSIYHGQTLVQSRLIRAQVTPGPAEQEGALESIVDYTLAPSLDPVHLEALPDHRLSVMLNRNADGTHGFSFVGEEDFASEASFRDFELQSFVDRTRGALRHAAWGDEESWEKQKRYLYEQVDPERLRGDLVMLAVRGFRVYAAIASRLGAGDAGKLNAIMRKPGFVQIASKESPTQLLPAALIYDYVGFDTTARDQDYKLCPAYVASLEAPAPLEATPCFQGDCPSRGDATIVCPSGFWGFRHALGVPVSVLPGDDAPPEILPTGNRDLTVAVSTDPDFTLRVEHELELRDLFQGYGWNYAASRQDALRVLKASRSQIVYFYCHGGVLDGTPYIQVGPANERGITADLLFSEGIRWNEPRPLVFINGCRTTALEPEKAIEFVSPLVQVSRAAGVIGTEITVFEPLARVFAKECLGRFVRGDPIGEAVRCARLALLKEGNPLGLVYVPFVLAGLRLAA
jgi:subtilase family serine protease